MENLNGRLWPATVRPGDAPGVTIPATKSEKAACVGQYAVRTEMVRLVRGGPNAWAASP